MDTQAFIKKVFHTALIITPPTNMIDSIQNIRRNNDSSFDRWMPHVNLAFPFFDIQDFDQAQVLLQNSLNKFESFEIALSTFQYFQHGKKCVMWLNPQSEGDKVRQLQQEILKVFPQLDELSKKSDNGYTPHLTCGTFQSNNIEKTLAQYQKTWKPINFTLSQIHLIMREGQDSPFKIIHSVNLKTVKDNESIQTNGKNE